MIAFMILYSYGYGQQIPTTPIDTLYVIDGLPETVETFNTIKPDSIISLTILKNTDTTLLNCRNPNRIIIIVKTKKTLTKREQRRDKRKQRLQNKNQMIKKPY